MWSDRSTWSATITTNIINMQRSENSCLPKPNKNLLWDTWACKKIELTLNQSHLPLRWRCWWLKMCKCCNLKVQVVILVGLPIETPGMGANLANKISSYQIRTHTASVINICFIIFTSHNKEQNINGKYFLQYFHHYHHNVIMFRYRGDMTSLSASRRWFLSSVAILIIITIVIVITIVTTSSSSSWSSPSCPDVEVKGRACGISEDWIHDWMEGFLSIKLSGSTSFLMRVMT